MPEPRRRPERSGSRSRAEDGLGGRRIHSLRDATEREQRLSRGRDLRRWDRRDQLDACLARSSDRRLPPAEVIVVVDHNPELLERTPVEPSLTATVIENRHARGAWRRPKHRDRGCGGVDRRLRRRRRAAEPTGSSGCMTASPTPARWGGRRADSSLDGTDAALVPDRVLLGLRLQLHGAARGRAGAQPDRRQHGGANEQLEEIGGFRAEGVRRGPARDLAPRASCSARGNVPDDTDLAIRVKQRWPEIESGCTSPRRRASHGDRGAGDRSAYFIRRSFEEGAARRTSRASRRRERPQLRAPSVSVVLPPRGGAAASGRRCTETARACSARWRSSSGCSSSGIGFLTGILSASGSARG